MKDLFKSLLILTPYDPSKLLVLYTDASFQNGFGYLLVQEQDIGSMNFIQCGSTGISDSQKKYSVYELELTELKGLEDVSLDSLKNDRF